MGTIRIACIGDSHLDERNRLDDNVAVHRAFIEQAVEAGVDLILHGGDFFERRSTPAERNALAEFLIDASHVAPVFGVKGNHDVEGDLDVFNRLSGRHPITIIDRPNLLTGWFPVIARMPTLGPSIACIGIPWFDKAHLVSQSDAGEDAASTTERTIQAARAMLNTLRATIAGSDPRMIPILVGHVLVAGSETSTGQVLVGTTVELAPSDLADLGCAYVHLSHIHKPQSWHGGRVGYSGSMQRGSFGEPEAKGWNLVTIDTERWREPDGVTVEFRELPARRIVLIEGDYPEIATRAIHAADVNGALVRFRYRIRTEDLHLFNEDLARSQFLNSGAHSVKIEAVLEHTERVRSTAIVEARGTFEKLEAFWSTACIEVPDATKERLRAKLAEIETRQRQEVAA